MIYWGVSSGLRSMRYHIPAMRDGRERVTVKRSVKECEASLKKKKRVRGWGENKKLLWRKANEVRKGK